MKMSMNEIRQVVRSEILLEYVAAMNEVAGDDAAGGDADASVEFSAHITDQATGDAFRAWVTTNYAEVAEVADLDAEGPWNNQFIRKVWDVLADEYIAADKQDIEAPDSNTAVLNRISTALTGFIDGLEDPVADADADSDALPEAVIREIFGRGHILSEAVASDVAKMAALKVAAAGGDTEAADKIIDMRMIMRPAIEQLQGLFTDNEGHTNDPEIVSIASGMDGSLAELLGSIAQAAYVISTASGEAIKGWLEMYQDVEGLPRGESRKAGEQLTAYDQLVGSVAAAGDEAEAMSEFEADEQDARTEASAIWLSMRPEGDLFEDVHRTSREAKRDVKEAAEAIRGQLAQRDTGEEVVLSKLEDIKVLFERYYTEDIPPLMTKMKTDQLRLVELTEDNLWTAGSTDEDKALATYFAHMSSWTPEDRRQWWGNHPDSKSNPPNPLALHDLWKVLCDGIKGEWSEHRTGVTVESVVSHLRYSALDSTEAMAARTELNVMFEYKGLPKVP
jgi:hypothetical protein